MMNIHLVQDEKFINGSIETFNYYYAAQNVYFVDVDENNRKLVKESDDVYFIPFQHKTKIKKIISSFYKTDGVINLFIHYMSRKAANLAIELKDNQLVDYLYWIFYGADLYSYLALEQNYKLYDYNVSGRECFLKDILKRIIGYNNYLLKIARILNYFCFWNYYDYLLFCEFIPTKAKFKLFYYTDIEKIALVDLVNKPTHLNVLVNHSASYTGNHLTILFKLFKIDSKKEIANIVLPLSYGAIKHKNLIIDKANSLFADRTCILDSFLPPQDYFNKINMCQVAIMGHRRQEAAGNISYFLLNGVKVFLREDNNLLKYYKNMGCHIYSFEKDLNTLTDLSPLTMKQKNANRNILQNALSKENRDKMMRTLITDEVN